MGDPAQEVRPDRITIETVYAEREPILQRACDGLRLDLQGIIDALASDGLFRAVVSEARVKKLQSVTAKAAKDGVDPIELFQSLDDLVGLRIACNNLEDVDLVVEAIDRHPLITVIRTDPVDRQYVALPSGYRARHVVIDYVVTSGAGQATLRAEVQVRTLLQDAWAKLSHVDIYKPGGGSVPPWIAEQMKSLSDDLHVLDGRAQSLRAAARNEYVAATNALLASVADTQIEDKEKAMSYVSQAIKSESRAQQLAGIEAFVQTPPLWEEHMGSFASVAASQDEWFKTSLLARINELEDDQAANFIPLVMEL